MGNRLTHNPKSGGDIVYALNSISKDVSSKDTANHIGVLEQSI